VEDAKEHLHFGQEEEADGQGHVQGNYHVQLPDGRLQSVAYHVNEHDGYIADVKYDGEAVHVHPNVVHHGDTQHLIHPHQGEYHHPIVTHHGEAHHTSIEHHGEIHQPKHLHHRNTHQLSTIHQDSSHDIRSFGSSGHSENVGHGSPIATHPAPIPSLGHFQSSSVSGPGLLGNRYGLEHGLHSQLQHSAVHHSSEHHSHGPIGSQEHIDQTFATNVHHQPIVETILHTSKLRLGKSEPLKVASSEQVNAFQPFTFFDNKPLTGTQLKTEKSHIVSDPPTKVVFETPLTHDLEEAHISNQHDPQAQFQFRNSKNEVKTFGEIQEEIKSIKNLHVSNKVENTHHVQQNVGSQQRKPQIVQQNETHISNFHDGKNEILNIRSGQFSQETQNIGVSQDKLLPQFKSRPIGISNIPPTKFKEILRKQRESSQHQNVFF